MLPYFCRCYNFPCLSQILCFRSAHMLLLQIAMVTEIHQCQLENKILLSSMLPTTIAEKSNNKPFNPNQNRETLKIITFESPKLSNEIF